MLNSFTVSGKLTHRQLSTLIIMLLRLPWISLYHDQSRASEWHLKFPPFFTFLYHISFSFNRHWSAFFAFCNNCRAQFNCASTTTRHVISNHVIHFFFYIFYYFHLFFLPSSLKSFDRFRYKIYGRKKRASINWVLTILCAESSYFTSNDRHALNVR